MMCFILTVLNIDLFIIHLTHKACGFESPGLDHLLYRQTLDNVYKNNMDNYKN